MLFENKFVDSNKKLGFDDVQIVPQKSNINSRKDVDLIGEWGKLKGVPVIVSNMAGVGVMEMARAVCPQGIFIALHKHYKVPQLTDFLSANPEIEDKIFLSCGLLDDAFYRMILLSNLFKKFNIRVDVPNGHMTKFVDFCKYIVDLFPDRLIIGGNVASPEGFEKLAKTGLKGVVVGIGNGNFCETKNKAGVGYPQISLCLDSYDISNQYNCLLISDGGIRNPADICKGLVAGADLMMCGTLFAGYDECDAEWEYEYKNSYGIWQAIPTGYIDSPKRKLMMKFFGMSSACAQDKFNGGMKEYRTSEGKEGWILFKGPVSNLVQDIKGGLASCCTYTGCGNIQELGYRGKFIRI